MLFNENLAIELGEGVLGWHPNERKTRRFGTVSLFKGLTGNERIIFPRYRGFYKLGATVIEARPSRFKSETIQFTDGKPEKLRNGQQAILGDGELFYEDPYCIGIKPRIDIPNGCWLTVKSLVQLQDQTVKLFIIPSLLA